MSFGVDYPVLSAGTAHASIDTFDATKLNNGAQNNLGSIYQFPLNPASLVTKGSGVNFYVKYVRYNPTVSQTILTGPAPVYYKDAAKQVVTPLQSEAYYAGANAIAGWLLYNTTTISTATAAQINGNFAFICVGGYIVGASTVAATAVGDALIGGATAFTPARVAANTAPTNKVIGFAETAVAGLLADVYVPFLN